MRLGELASGIFDPGRIAAVEVAGVTDDSREPFVFDRRLPDGKGKVVIKLP